MSMDPLDPEVLPERAAMECQEPRENLVPPDETECLEPRARPLTTMDSQEVPVTPVTMELLERRETEETTEILECPELRERMDSETQEPQECLERRETRVLMEKME